MNILVIGGAGYIGSVTVELLIKKKHRVIILDDLSTGCNFLIHPKSIFYHGSVLDRKILEKIFTKHKIDLVYHYAAKTIVEESMKEPIMYFSKNIGGLANVLEVMVTYNVKKIIFASSAAVYGKSKTFPITEETEKEPCNPYGASKLCCEQLIINTAIAHKINYVIFRFFNVAGSSITGKYGMAKKNPTLLIPALNDCLINKKKITIYGNNYKTKDGTCLRDYIHVHDLAQATICGINFLKKNKSEIFNLGSSKGYTVLDVVKIAKKNIDPTLKFFFAKKRDGDPDKLLANAEKAHKLLKWRAKYNLKKMIISDYKFRKKYGKFFK